MENAISIVVKTISLQNELLVEFKKVENGATGLVMDGLFSFDSKVRSAFQRCLSSLPTHFGEPEMKIDAIDYLFHELINKYFD